MARVLRWWLPRREPDITDQPQAQEPAPIRGADSDGLAFVASRFAGADPLRSLGFYTVRSVSDVRVLEVIHGDERTMEAVGLAVMWSLADPSRVVVDLSTLVVSTEPVWPSSSITSGR